MTSSEAPEFESVRPGEAELPTKLSVGAPPSVVPGVIVLDASWSMANELAAVRSAMNDFVIQLRRTPAVAELAHIAIVTFADTARTELDFCQIADPQVEVAHLTPYGFGTNFTAALDEAYRLLEQGIPRLARATSAERRTVMRPTIYFISDGMHNADANGWETSLRRLDQPKWRPNRFAFGFSQADRAAIGRIADEGCAYFVEDGNTPLKTLEQILGVILKSMVALSQSASQGGGNTPVPPAPPGMVKVDPVA